MCLTVCEAKPQKARQIRMRNIQVSGLAARLATLISQNETMQWQTSDMLASLQVERLRLLAEHLQSYSPHFAMRLLEAGLTPNDLLAPGGFAAAADVE